MISCGTVPLHYEGAHADIWTVSLLAYGRTVTLEQSQASESKMVAGWSTGHLSLGYRCREGDKEDRGHPPPQAKMPVLVFTHKYTHAHTSIFGGQGETQASVQPRSLANPTKDCGQ